MAKGNNQKLKLLYLMKFLMDNTDENHAVDMGQILEYLAKNEIGAERKSIYDDIKALQDYGIDVVGYKEGRSFYYRVVSRDFQIPELKLLVDAVQSSKFITTEKSRELINKLEKLASKHDASKLHRQVLVTNRVKAINEGVLYSIDCIHEAMAINKQITFKYYKWNHKKQKEYGHDGALYKVSPWALVWEDENYYMVAFDSEVDKIKHYRVDKMEKVEVSENDREGKEAFSQSNIAEYTNKHFGMFSGKDASVTLVCDNFMAGVIIDRFGKDIMIMPVDEGHFKVSIKASVSSQFFGWVFSLKGNVKITGPDWVVAAMREEIAKQADLY